MTKENITSFITTTLLFITRLKKILGSYCHLKIDQHENEEKFTHGCWNF